MSSLTCTETASRRRRLLAFVLSAVSGLLLFACFPPLGWSNAAYMALVPLLWALRLDPGAKLRLGYCCGLVAWVPSLWFLSPVTIPGLLVLAAYCALYLVPVAWWWGRALERWQPGNTWLAVRLVVGGAAAWALMEVVRGGLLTGFPWNQLGVSQWQNYGLIQIAAFGGVPVVSFVLLTLNLGIAVSVMSVVETVGKRLPRRAHPELYIPILLLAFSFTWGIRDIRRRAQEPSRTLRMAVVQPMAGMEEKWDPEMVYENYRVLWQYSDLALSATRPDVLVWPETALPEVFGAPQAEKMLADLLQRGVPMLVGALDSKLQTDADGISEQMFWNASMLLEPGREEVGRYAKKHLVMFGEYIPFARTFPFLRSLSPFPEDVTPGEGSSVLRVEQADVCLGILICFEDLLPYLARAAVAEGAELFVNQTNDAWFDPLWGSEGHLAHAVFRSVEFRRPTLRAANSGVSGWIDTRGVVQERMPVRQPGFSPFEVCIPLEMETTFFQRRPWVFPLLWLGLTCGVLGVPGAGKARFFHRREM